VLQYHLPGRVFYSYQLHMPDASSHPPVHIKGREALVFYIGVLFVGGILCVCMRPLKGWALFLGGSLLTTSEPYILRVVFCRSPFAPYGA
jgi:hypothetical protein